MQNLKTAWLLLDRKARRRGWAAAIGSLALAGLDAASVAMMLPLSSALLGGSQQSVPFSSFGPLGRLSLLAQIAALLLALVVAKNACAVWRARGNAVFLSDVQANLASRLFAHDLSLDYASHVRRGSAALLHELQNAVVAYRGQVLRPLLDGLTESAVFLLLVGLVVFTNPVAGLFAVLLIGICGALVVRATRARLVATGREWMRSSEAASQLAHQVLGGVKDVKLASAEPHFEKEYSAAAREFAKADAKHATAMAAPRALLEICAVGVVAMLVVGAAGNATGWLGLLGAAAFRLVPGVQRIAGSFALVRSSMWCLDALRPLLSAPARKEDATAATTARECRRVSLRNIHFAHDGGREVLRGACLELHAGSITGLRGKSGAGKTTLANVLSGLLQAPAARFELDGRAADPASQAWRRRVAVVSQDIFLLDASIRANVAFGVPDAEIDDGRVLHALALAQLGEFVAALPRGLATTIGERGATLSGGQVQRMALARAMYRNPWLLILDEPTNALDVRTEQAVLSALVQLKSQCAILLIAHHERTLSICDRVFELSGGRVHETETEWPRVREPAEPEMQA